jgi:hypothetical protein
MGNGKARVFMDNMVEDVKKSVLDLEMKVKDLANNDAELARKALIETYYAIGENIDNV